MQGTFEGRTIKLMPQLTLLKKIEASFGLTIQFILLLNIAASPAKTPAPSVQLISMHTVTALLALFNAYLKRPDGFYSL